MAHNITASDKFVFTGSRSNIWHRIGAQIADGRSAVEVAQEAFPWQTVLASMSADGVDGARVELPNHRAHLRADNNALLGVVSDGYRPVENADLAKFADALAVSSDGVAKVSTAGSLLGGRRVFFGLALPTLTLRLGVDGVDEQQHYMIVSNGHGGHAAVAGYTSSVRVVCQNTLSLSERDMGTGVRFHHTGDVTAKLDVAAKLMAHSVADAERFNAQATALAQRDLSADDVTRFFGAAFLATFGAAPTHSGDGNLLAKWMEKRERMLKDWMERFEGERQTLAGIQGTAWAALNAYTEWSDHDRGGAWANKDEGVRFESSMFGTQAAAKKKVLAAALTLV